MVKNEVYSEIGIKAPAYKVWEVLTDFDSFPQWNPFIKKASGEIKIGEKLNVYLESAKIKMALKPIVLNVESNKELRWKGKFWISGLFDGEHIFRIQRSNDESIFIQKEVFTGLLVLLFRFLEVDIRKKFEEMNRSLKERVESLNK